jgi:hypothetical protein
MNVISLKQMNLLTLVHKNGIVNQFQIKDSTEFSGANLTLIQLIWNNKINYKIVGLNENELEEQCGETTSNIKDYRAVYLNGVLIVKNGNVYPKNSIIDSIVNWFKG